MSHPADLSMLVFLPVYKGAESLIEVNQPYIHILRELILVEQLDPLCLSVDVCEASLDLTVEGALTE
jgi:hypothetical protein